MPKSTQTKPDFMPQALPPEQSADTNDEVKFGSAVRDPKGRYPSSLNVGGTHPKKKHPGTRHYKD